MATGNYYGEIRRENILLLNVIVLLLSIGLVAHAETGQDVHHFRQGTLRMSVVLGSGTAFDQDYTVVGMGAGYYIADGLEAGLDADAWTGNDPALYRISPQLRYVFHGDAAIKPYIGVFYRRMLIEGYDDNDTAGLRAGALFLSGRNVYFGAGFVHDVHMNCDRTVFQNCSETYPELVIAVML